MNERGDVELAERVPDRVPEAFTQGRGLRAALIGVGVEQRPDEAVLGYAAAQFVRPAGRAGLHALRHSGHATEPAGLQPAGAGDGVIGLFREPLDQFGLLAVHHLVGPGRDELDVNAGVVKVLQV